MSIDDAKPEEWHEAAFLARVAVDNASVDPTPRDIEALNRVLGRPFGEVPYMTRAYVFLLHQMGKVEVFRKTGADALPYPLWRPTTVYRVVAIEKSKTKPSIDWSHVAPQYKWLARDENGSGFIYADLPKMSRAAWSALDYEIARLFASYTPGDCDWKDSLVERPAGI